MPPWRRSPDTLAGVPNDLDSAGVYFLSIEEFEGRPKKKDSDRPGRQAPLEEPEAGEPEAPEPPLPAPTRGS